MNKQFTWKEVALAATCALLPVLAPVPGILANRWATLPDSAWLTWEMAAALSVLTRGFVGVSICVLMRMRVFRSRWLNLLAFGVPLTHTLFFTIGRLCHVGIRAMVGTFGLSVLPILLVPCVWRCVELCWKRKSSGS